jgi:hypothetical protein
MTPVDYNQKQIQEGKFTQTMIATLVEFWQSTHSLEVDAKCGPNTQQSIVSAIFGDEEDIGALSAAALNIARREIGNGEEGGNNSGQYVAEYHRIEDDGDDDDDGSWCAAFISYCFEEAAKELGVEMPFARSGGAKKLFSNIASSGQVTENPRPGDVVCWDRGDPGSWQGHIGIVESVSDGILHTIEGNVGAYPSKVKRLSHDLASQTRLEGFARSGEPGDANV